MKCGFIAVVGKPNVGKSSLVNALIGEKISIVSPKAQTTRDKITGILTTDLYQMIFIDTPGFILPKNELGNYMDKCIKSASLDVDVIALVLDAGKNLSEKDFDTINKYSSMGKPLYVILNKCDLVGYQGIYPILDKLKNFVLAEKGNPKVKEIIPASAKLGTNIDKIKDFFIKELKEDGAYYPLDEVTDKSERYMVCELIREKALWLLEDEIPHGIGVLLQKFEDKPEIVKIEADIICEKESHKQIIIGKEGSMIKTISEKARLDIEKLLGKKVYLRVFVKVRDGWRDRRNIMDDIGYKFKS